MCDTYQSAFVRFLERPADLPAASQEIDFAILKGTHASALRFLLAGKPALHLPIVLEQRSTAERIASLGCGVSVVPGDVRGICIALDALCHDSSFATQSQRFMAAHQPWQKPDELDDRHRHLAPRPCRSDIEHWIGHHRMAKGSRKGAKTQRTRIIFASLRLCVTHSPD